MSDIIDDLIDEGALVLYHDYRAGHLQDLSGHGNHGVPTATKWESKGLSFVDPGSMVTVPDSDELQLTEGTLIVMGQWPVQSPYTTIERLISKRDAGGVGYELSGSSTPSIYLYDGILTRTIAGTYVGHDLVGLNMKDGITGEVFMDGVSIGNLLGASSITATPCILTIGANWGANFQTHIIKAALIVNRQLTATEHTLLYAALLDRKYPTAHISRADYSLGAELLVDRNCEAATPAAYTAGNAATLSKQQGNALGGDLVLRVAHGGAANPYASQSILTAGTEYLVTGWARGDATGAPRISHGTTVVWEGIAAAVWQYFEESLLAGATDLRFENVIAVAGYSEFDRMSVRQLFGEEVQFQTDYAVEGVSETNLTTGYVERSPWQIDSGTHRVVYDSIENKDALAIESTVGGRIYLEAHQQQLSSRDAAYGQWDWWFYKPAGAALNPVFMFIAEELQTPTHASQNGYHIDVTVNNALQLTEVAAGTNTVIMATNSNAVSIGAWHHVRVTRTFEGEFSVYLDGELITVITGTNPIIDNNHQEAPYSIFTQCTDGLISIASVKGNHAYIKSHF